MFIGRQWRCSMFAAKKSVDYLKREVAKARPALSHGTLTSRTTRGTTIRAKAAKATSSSGGSDLPVWL